MQIVQELVLAQDKQYLVESRLLPVARRAGLRDLGELVRNLRSAGSPALAEQVVEAMTTNRILLLSRQDSLRAVSRNHHA